MKNTTRVVERRDKHVHATLTPTALTAVRAIADEKQVPVAVVIRWAVAEYLDRQGAAA